MKPYFIKTPWWLKKIYGAYRWDIPSIGNNVYLTFDDGPHPVATPFVLDQLKAAEAKASFFCIGNNVLQHPHLFQRICEEGHTVGNHTHTHRNGWKTNNADYLDDIRCAQQLIPSNLFRPPYGRIKRSQAVEIKKMLGADAQIIMWDILSADFDETISGEQCLTNVLKHLRAGSIIVMHDSQKAWNRLHYALPIMLKEIKERGFELKSL